MKSVLNLNNSKIKEDVLVNIDSKNIKGITFDTWKK